jgi:molybdenum-dependent DNA-binding transcriptional regulator ModE
MDSWATVQGMVGIQYNGWWKYMWDYSTMNGRITVHTMDGRLQHNGSSGNNQKRPYIIDFSS